MINTPEEPENETTSTQIEYQVYPSVTISIGNQTISIPIEAVDAVHADLGEVIREMKG